MATYLLLNGVRNTRKQESEAANEIAMNILYRQDVTKAGLTTNPLNVATHHLSGSGKYNERNIACISSRKSIL